MKIVVDREKCTGLGVCESMASGYFEVDLQGQLALLRGDDTEVDAADAADVELAVSCCPNEALRVEN